MDLIVLAVPDCPNVALLEERLASVLHGRRNVTLSRQVITDAGQAARWGMHGSPTVLVNGADPFAVPGQEASVSCRLYRDENGRASAAPSAAQLRRAIDQAAGSEDFTEDSAWLDALGRSGRGRIAPAGRGLRAVHQTVLRSFAQAGTAPALSQLEICAAPFAISDVLAELAEADFLCLDDDGGISAAYPFSAVPTPHRVRIADGAAVHAMCAIDALGISAMTGSSIEIRSADPWTAEPVTVTVDGSQSAWHPATAVVFAGRTAGECAGPSAAVCCRYMNFFATRASAAAWAAAQPEISGGILDQERAVQVGIRIFGELLR
jgi:hypothetical protein